MFVATASCREVTLLGKTVRPLVEWGRLIGVGDPDAAQPAGLTVTITVTNQVGSLAAGAQLLNSDTGVTYATTATVLLDAPTKTVTIEAIADQSGGGGAGAIGNMDPSDILPFANPLANVARDTVVLTLDSTGTDEQSETSYRQEVVDRFQKRPQGGAKVDYDAWGRIAEGVATIFPYQADDAGEVDVYVLAETSVNPDGIPPGSLLTEVFDEIEKDVLGLASRRPVGAFVRTLAITRTAFDVTILDLDPDTSGNKAAATAAMEAYFFNRAPFVDGLTPPPRADSITLTEITAELVRALSPLSATFASAQFELSSGSIPLTIYTLDKGETAKADAVLFT
jgi:uncharacterized phage protein gp47/JayE